MEPKYHHWFCQKFKDFITAACWEILQKLRNLTFFIYLYNQLSSFNSIILEMSEKRDLQIECKSEWLLLSVTFTAKFELSFVNIRKLFLGSFNLRLTERT